jgi:hypothetical protein
MALRSPWLNPTRNFFCLSNIPSRNKESKAEQQQKNGKHFLRLHKARPSPVQWMMGKATLDCQKSFSGKREREKMLKSKHTDRPRMGPGPWPKFRLMLGLLLNKPKAQTQSGLGFGIGPWAWLFCLYSKSPHQIFLNKLPGPKKPKPKVFRPDPVLLWENRLYGSSFLHQSWK